MYGAGWDLPPTIGQRKHDIAISTNNLQLLALSFSRLEIQFLYSIYNSIHFFGIFQTMSCGNSQSMMLTCWTVTTNIKKIHMQPL